MVWSRASWAETSALEAARVALRAQPVARDALVGHDAAVASVSPHGAREEAGVVGDHCEEADAGLAGAVEADECRSPQPARADPAHLDEHGRIEALLPGHAGEPGPHGRVEVG